ncbi:hypothetical protein O6H91_17G063000 [Diphasiastrum complanatum]|uniref:Uncharacterized protein n=3 Tax=Diphasiastrum complanatum TaxID=34168 RepID=A0ACC2B7I7_DIPCM|nr:hypothetical protein O6H91_17G063000 [Diphasiastrum complanatum]
MGLHRQGGGGGAMPPVVNMDHKISGSQRSGTAHRSNDHGGSDQANIGSVRPLGTWQSETGNRSALKGGRGRKLGRIAKIWHSSVGFYVVILFCVVAFTVLGSDYLFAVGRAFAGDQETSTSTEFFDDQQENSRLTNQQMEKKRLGGKDQIDAAESFHLRSRSREKGEGLSRLVSEYLEKNNRINEVNKGTVNFGLTVDQNDGHKDSRYWDSDDRKREMDDSTSAENEASRLSQALHREGGKNGNTKIHFDSSNWDSDERLHNRDNMTLQAGSELSENGNREVEWRNVSVRAQSNHSEIENQEGLVKSSAAYIYLHSKEKLLEKSSHSKEQTNIGEHRTSIMQPEDHTEKNPALYNETGRKELRIYEQQFEAQLNSSLNNSTQMHNITVDGADSEYLGEDDGYNNANEDDGGEMAFSATDERKHYSKDEYTQVKEESIDDKQSQQAKNDYLKTKVETAPVQSLTMNTSNQLRRRADEGAVLNTDSNATSDTTDGMDGAQKYSSRDSAFHLRTQDIKSINKVNISTFKEPRKSLSGQALEAPLNWSMLEHKVSKGQKRRKHSGAACEIDFLNSTKGLKEPDLSARFFNFTMNYVDRETLPEGDSEWEPRFAGHQTLLEREESFNASDKTIHCGFVQDPQGTLSTWFKLSENDMNYLSTCHIAVSSCIFGNWDYIRSPNQKKPSSSSKKKVCFVMFVDQKSLDVMINEGQVPDENGYVGLWRIVTVKNLPYSDGRRMGKVPKFLTHRLFPFARYSIWVDSKLRLLSDPLLILEHFLWRGGHEYAISNHYDRHSVSEEVQQNKRLRKFNHSVIDEQYAFYQKDGLTEFNVSDPKRLLPSYVPEGSFIIRAHTPMSNLFSCLWFNEVDRFTPRDQLSFAYTYLKLVRTNPGKHFFLHMFKDCERKAMAKLFRHRQDESSMLEKSAHNFVN